jgi:hypothetical protein
MVCKDCVRDIPKHRIDPGVNQRNFYVDDHNCRWNGRMCPDCHRNDSDVRRRAKGLPTVDESKNPRRQKGRLAERQVATYFEALGFHVELTRLTGPDLIGISGNVEFTVEVKSAVRSRQGSKSWFVAPVYPARRNDDKIAIVLPDGRIHVEDMEAHLRKCNPSGQRFVTHMVEVTA